MPSGVRGFENEAPVRVWPFIPCTLVSENQSRNLKQSVRREMGFLFLKPTFEQVAFLLSIEDWSLADLNRPRALLPLSFCGEAGVGGRDGGGGGGRGYRSATYWMGAAGEKMVS